MKCVVDCDRYSTKKIADIPYIDAAAILDEENNRLVIAVLNRSLSEDADIKIKASDFGVGKKIRHILFNHNDLKAINTAENPENVTFRDMGYGEIFGESFEIKAEKHSFNMFLIDLE